MFLTHEELQELTHKQRPAAQIRALRMMGIRYERRPDGTPAVLKDLLYESARPSPQKEYEPDFSDIN